MTTEYERLLNDLIEEKKAKLSKVRSSEGSKKQVDDLLSEISYIELQLDHYAKGLKLFRSKSVPKVGRWGRAEAEEHGPADGTATGSS
jgi:hypothetical protein